MSTNPESNPRRVFSGAPWEKKVGYCRAIRVANWIAVTGTASVGDDGNVHAPGDGYRQALKCFEIIESALKGLDADITHIIRTRMFVTDISKWKEFGRAHAETFKDHPPTTSMVEVKSLINSQMLIEIEADAFVPSSAV
jgi:enamine deaminase RidA (YjgF/YER057c/UK114 family)